MSEPTLKDVEEQAALLQARAFIKESWTGLRGLSISQWVAKRMKDAADRALGRTPS